MQAKSEMDEFNKARAEALKSELEKKINQFCIDLNSVFKTHNLADIDSIKLFFAREDKSLENEVESEKEITNGAQDDWTMEIRLSSSPDSPSKEDFAAATPEKNPEKISECKIISYNPWEIDCS